MFDVRDIVLELENIDSYYARFCPIMPILLLLRNLTLDFRPVIEGLVILLPKQPQKQFGSPQAPCTPLT